MGKKEGMLIVEEPLYHDTWKLLKKYRDVVWSFPCSRCATSLRLNMEIRLKTFWIRSIWQGLISQAAILSIMPNVLNAAIGCWSFWTVPLTCCGISIRTGRAITGCCTIPIFRHSSWGTWRRSLRSYGPISGILACALIIGKDRSALGRSVLSYGDIRPRTAWRFWSSLFLKSRIA